MSPGVVTGVVVILALVIVLAAAVRKVPPHRAYVIAVLGRYRRTLPTGAHLLVPFVETVRAKVDLREQEARFPPQPAITADDLVACIRAVLHYRVVDPVRVTYEISDHLRALEMATITILRTLMGSMTLEQARNRYHEIGVRLAAMLREYVGPWGIEVGRTEIEAIEAGSRQGCPTTDARDPG